MQKTERRGRPRLPVRKRVAWRLVRHFGSKRRIKTMLTRGGYTKVDVAHRAFPVIDGTRRERARKIIELIGIIVARDHTTEWRLAHFLRTAPVLRKLPEARRAYLARSFSSSRWLKKGVRRFGSLDRLATHYKLPAQPVRAILSSEGVPIPHRIASTVRLRCQNCTRRFRRIERLHLLQVRRLRRRKRDPFVFCRRSCFYSFRRKHPALFRRAKT